MSLVREGAPAPGVLSLTIDRPEKRNALNAVAYAVLGAALERAGADAAVRVVVLTGAGGHFTAGNDLADFREREAGQDEAESPALAFLHALAGLAKPVIAAVEGHAVGIGTTLLLHCDLAYAGAGARFRLPFTALGLSPEGGSSRLLARAAGPKRAAEMLLLGEPFGAEAAREAGLVNAVTGDGEALPAALAKATALAGLPAGAVEATKMLLRREGDEPIAETLRVEAEQFRALRASPEAQAAFAAFLGRAKGG